MKVLVREAVKLSFIPFSMVVNIDGVFSLTDIPTLYHLPFFWGKNTHLNKHRRQICMNYNQALVGQN